MSFINLKQLRSQRGKERMNKYGYSRVLGLLLLSAALFLSACGARKKEPITLSVWHVYGGQTDSPLNQLIDEFNETVGAEKGIILQVMQVSNTNTIHESVLAAANHEPGAAKLPDLFISYPKTVLAMPDSAVLVDYRDYFSEKELSAFLPEFLEEGMIDGRLLVLPAAKSTEILFIDKTLFDRFSADTGADLEQLRTWEGLFAMSEDYYRWLDAKTPDIPHDGRCFFVHDYHFNYLQLGTESLGEDFFSGNQLAFGEAFHRVWMPYARAAIQGGVWLGDGYATDPLRTGEAVASVASSASVLYYEDIVTYPDNVSEPVQVVSYALPIMEGGEKLAIQRGAGFCLTKSNPKREAAAVEFLKWLTEPKCNLRFVTSTGYMPVTEQAFAMLPEVAETLESGKYCSLYHAMNETRRDYQFYTPPQLSTYLDLEMSVEKNARKILQNAREKYLAALSPEDEGFSEEAITAQNALAEQLAEEALTALKLAVQRAGK